VCEGPWWVCGGVDITLSTGSVRETCPKKISTQWGWQVSYKGVVEIGMGWGTHAGRQRKNGDIVICKDGEHETHSKPQRPFRKK